MQIHEMGEPGKARIVLLHGVPGSSQAWARSARDLSQDHHVLVPDLLGFGDGARSDDIHAEAQAAALAASLGEKAIDRAAFVGHDFGGPIAMSLFARSPELFSHLVLMSTNAFPDTPIPFPLSLVTLPRVGDAMARLIFSEPSLRMMLRIYGGTELGDVRSVRTIFRDSLQQLEELYGSYPQILATVDVPTLVMWGDRDPFFPLEHAYRTADAIPGAAMRIIEGAGHFLPETHPDIVTSEIRAFVTREARTLLP